jgi:hypothetical protein
MGYGLDARSFEVPASKPKPLYNLPVKEVVCEEEN